MKKITKYVIVSNPKNKKDKKNEKKNLLDIPKIKN
jgi:hypothetical protein